MPKHRVAGCKHHDGYIVIGLDYALWLAHRLAWLYMTGSFPSGLLDHKNGDRSDNRWSNIREASRAQNSQNTRRKRGHSCGYKGVSRSNKCKRFRAVITVDGKQIRLGNFATPEQANKAYAEAARQHFGEFARSE